MIKSRSSRDAARVREMRHNPVWEVIESCDMTDGGLYLQPTWLPHDTALKWVWELEEEMLERFNANPLLASGFRRFIEHGPTVDLVGPGDRILEAYVLLRVDVGFGTPQWVSDGFSQNPKANGDFRNDRFWMIEDLRPERRRLRKLLWRQFRIDVRNPFVRAGDRLKRKLASALRSLTGKSRARTRMENDAELKRLRAELDALTELEEQQRQIDQNPS